MRSFSKPLARTPASIVSGSSRRPKEVLIAASQAETALTKTTSAVAMLLRTLEDNREGSPRHQRKTWVSSRSRLSGVTLAPRKPLGSPAEADHRSLPQCGPDPPTPQVGAVRGSGGTARAWRE